MKFINKLQSIYKKSKPSKISDSNFNQEWRPGSSNEKKEIDQNQKQSWDPSDSNIPLIDGKTRFNDLNLHPQLLRSIFDLGWEYATPIQAEILPHTLKRKDMAGRAQTGTGKTAAFLMSIINHCLSLSLIHI